ncbi:MAG: hypothetical protein J6X65_00535 [Bacteroidales bacterium]|nr:hypothetical protein [Bacteroidales bacterium]
MLKKSFILVLLIGLITGFIPQLQAQEDDNEMNIAGPGADFIIAGGIYFGGKGPAGYYSGKPENENNLNYIYGNKYIWRDQITRLIADNNNFISPNDTLVIGKDDYPEDMRYKPAMSVTLGISYRFDKHWRLTLYYSFARLTTVGGFNVQYTNYVPGNERPEFLTYNLVGKENRSFFDLTGSYTFHVNKVVKPFIELGAQFNFVRVKSFDAVIENKTYNLLDVYGGQTYVPGAGMQELDTRYGGAGFGFVGATGIKFAFNKGVSVDPCFYVSFGKVGLNGYKDFHFNYGAYVRLVMSDALFQH